MDACNALRPGWQWVERRQRIMNRPVLWIYLDTGEGEVDYLPIDLMSCPPIELEEVKLRVKREILKRVMSSE